MKSNYRSHSEKKVFGRAVPGICFNRGLDSGECRVVHFLSTKSDHSAGENAKKIKNF